MKLHEWILANKVKVLFELKPGGDYKITLGLFQKIEGYRLVEQTHLTFAGLQAKMDSFVGSSEALYKMGDEAALQSRATESSTLVELLTPGTIKQAIEKQLKEYPEFGLPAVDETLAQIPAGYAGIKALLNMKGQADPNVLLDPGTIAEAAKRRATLWLDQIKEQCPLEKKSQSTLSSDIELA